ncbi:hypothetical protein CCP3SC15_1540005 [Gammaproteobacteria bacterium]
MVGRTGKPSAVDVNVLNMTDAEFDAINPDWVKRRGEVTPPPPPPVEKKMYATVLKTGLRERTAPTNTTNNVIASMQAGATVEITQQVKADGITWGKFEGWIAIDPAYCKVEAK